MSTVSTFPLMPAKDGDDLKLGESGRTHETFSENTYQTAYEDVWVGIRNTLFTGLTDNEPEQDWIWRFENAGLEPTEKPLLKQDTILAIAQSVGVLSKGAWISSGLEYVPCEHGSFLSRSFIDPMSRWADAAHDEKNEIQLQDLSSQLIAATGRLASQNPIENIALKDADLPPLDRLASRALTCWEEVYRKYAVQTDPIVEAAIRSLANHLPPPASRLAILHGLGPFGGCLISPNFEFLGLVNWHFSHLGDPIEDLTWAMCKSNHLGGPKASGHITTVEAIAIWQAECGYSIDPQTLAWWQIMTSLKAIALARLVIGRGRHTDEVKLLPSHALWAVKTITVERAHLAKTLPPFQADYS